MAGNLHVRNLDDDLIAKLKMRAAWAIGRGRAP
jgi:plasmid stability protein